MVADVAEDAPVDAEVQTEVQTEESAPSHRKFNLDSKKTKILVLLAVVMAVEAAGIYFVLPKPAGNVISGGQGSGESPQNDGDGLNVNTVEVEVGNFNTVITLPSGVTVHVTFKVVAVVSADSAQKFKDEALKEYNGRVKQAILKVIRSSSLEDLGDPELGVIKRQIREEVNKALRKSYIIEVVISEFRRMEQ